MGKHSTAGKLSIAVIGKSGHAARLMDLVRRHPDATLACAYYPKPAEGCTTDFGAVLAADAVIVASPTPTHAEYLRKLDGYKGYVLLEKPAVSAPAEDAELRAWPEERKRRLRVNYNMAFSAVRRELEAVLAMPAFGEPVYLDVHVSYGPAHRPGSQSGWKTDRTRSFGALESIGVHFIHLAQSLFGPIAESSAAAGSIVKKTDAAVDSGVVRFTTARGVFVNVFHSHAAPYYYRVHLLGTNGYWEWDGAEAKLFSPRETVGADGGYAPPPLLSRKPLDQYASAIESLSAAMDDFIQTARTDGRFTPAELELALTSMDPLLKLRR